MNNDNIYLYVEDIDNGVRVQCNLCNHQFDKTSGGLKIKCPNCEKEITYPMDAEW